MPHPPALDSAWSTGAADGALDHRSGALVERDGRVRLLASSDWSVEVRGTWRSAASGAVYPAAGRVAVPSAGLRVAVRPEVAAAESLSQRVPGVTCWEGPLRLTGEDGRITGEGNVELTGYGSGTRPPI